MDNFLQLVPMEADADDSDSALVYGDEDDLTTHGSESGVGHGALGDATVAVATDDSAAQFFAPLAQFVAAAAPPITGTVHHPSALSPEEQRARFLRLLQMMESSMHTAQESLDKRLDTVLAIQRMGDPGEQLAEYLPLLAEQRRAYEDDKQDHAGVAVELLECAQQMSDPHDAEIALLAAFVFLSDGPDSTSRQRSAGSIAPAVAAIMDESNNPSLTEQTHNPF